ncbi:MAG: tetratricopeptide repeat protein [Bryobacteraceae bacterium]
MHTWTVLLLAAWLGQAGVGSSLNAHWAAVPKAHQLLEAGRYSEADQLIEQTWAAARRLGPVETSFLNIADATAQYYSGEGYILKAYAVWTAALADTAAQGANHPLRRQIQERRAWLLQSQGQTVEAAAVFKQLLDAAPDNDGGSRSRYVQTLAGLKETMGLVEEAEALFVEADRLQALPHRPPPPSIGFSRVQFHGPGPLAGFLQRRGRLEEAEKLYREAIERAEQSDTPATEEAALRSYSGFLRSQRRFDEAGTILRQVIARQAESGNSNRQDRWLRSQLAQLEREAGRPAEALRLLDEAAEEASRRWGPGSEEHQATLSDLLSMRMATGSADGAEELALAVFRMAEGGSPNYHRQNALLHLVNLYQRQNRPGDAARVRGELQELERQMQGPAASPSVDSLVQSMYVALQSKNVDAALASAGQALELAAGQHRRGHHFAAVASAAVQIAHAGRREDAIALFRRSLQALEQNLPPDHPSIGSQFEQLSHTAAGLDLGAEATDLLARAEEIFTAVAGPDSSAVLGLRRRQIDALRSRGEFAEALANARSLLATNEANQGAGSDAAMSTLHVVFELHASQNDWAGAARIADDLLARSARSRGLRNAAHGWLLLSLAQTLGRSPEPQAGLALADQAIQVFEQRRASPGELEAARNTRASIVTAKRQAAANRWFDVESTR